MLKGYYRFGFNKEERGRKRWHHWRHRRKWLMLERKPLMVLSVRDEMEKKCNLVK